MHMRAYGLQAIVTGTGTGGMAGATNSNGNHGKEMEISLGI
jgi:hypothetical protein